MTAAPPPEQPGMYADAHGAWWYWDGATWTPAPSWGPLAQADRRSSERGQALLMWVLYLVIGGWVGALIFYLINRDKPFVRHHSAEALNLSIAMLVPQVLAAALMAPFYIELITSEPGDDLSVPAVFFVGLAVMVLTSIANLVLGITGAVKAHRGRWWRLPIGLHPVRGVLRRGEAPPYDVST